jgi:hypothetical protein
MLSDLTVVYSSLLPSRNHNLHWGDGLGGYLQRQKGKLSNAQTTRIGKENAPHKKEKKKKKKKKTNARMQKLEMPSKSAFIKALRVQMIASQQICFTNKY